MFKLSNKEKSEINHGKISIKGPVDFRIGKDIKNGGGAGGTGWRETILKNNPDGTYYRVYKNHNIIEIINEKIKQ